MATVEERTYSQRKCDYFERLVECIEQYPKIFVVHADNVGSNQMQHIRAALRGKAEVLMGKNTVMRKCIRQNLEKFPQVEPLLQHVRGNIGFVFTDCDLSEIRDLIVENKRPAPARTGVIAPLDVWVPAGPTVMDPSKTSFFQALNIATKITRGNIDILKDVHLIKEGDKVDASQTKLLEMLNITPFSYGLSILNVYDNGTIFEPSVLDITNEDIYSQFAEGITKIASVSLAIGYPTAASIPHSIINGFKNCLALAAVTDISFKEAEQMKAYLADPSAFAAASAPAAAAEAAPAAAEEKKEESESSDGDMGFGMFD